MATTLDEATIARQANRRIRRSDNITGWAFAGPSVIIVLGLSFIPMIWAAYLSLTDSNLVSPRFCSRSCTCRSAWRPGSPWRSC